MTSATEPHARQTAVAPSPAGAPHVREIRLADLPDLSRQLADTVTASGFQPDCIVYLERGGRMLAAELCRELGVGAVPLYTNRRGAGIKRRLGGVASRLPGGLNDLLRQMESRWLSGYLRPSAVEVVERDVRLHGARVLIVDDAVDTGASVDVARAWILSQGADMAAVRVASITVTSDRARSEVDFHVHVGLCRFPWSPDSAEHPRYVELRDAIAAPPYQGSAAVARER